MNIKTTFKKIFVIAAFGLCYSAGSAQVIFTETFEGATDPGTLLPTSWTETGLSTDGFFFVGTDVDANSAGAWPVPAHTLFAMSNDDACNCDKSVDFLQLPVQDLSTYVGGLNLSFAASLHNVYLGTAFVKVSTDGGATFTSVYTIPSVGSDVAPVWVNYTIPLNAYVGMSNVLFAFHYDDQAQWGSGLAIDDVSLTIVPPSVDVTVTSGIGLEYSIMPVTENSVIPVDLVISNIGSDNAVSVAVTTNIYNASNITTPILTFSNTTANLAAGANVTLTMGSFTPNFIGGIIFEHIAISSGDVNTANDTLYENTSFTQYEYARDNGVPFQALGTNPGTSIDFGNIFTITNEVVLDSALMFINPAAAAVGNNVKFVVTPVIAGVPSNTYIGQSANYTIAAAGVDVIVLPITNISTGGPLTLTPGVYFLGYSKVEAAGQNHGIQCADTVFNNNTVYVRLNGGAFQTIESLGFSVTPIIRAYVKSTCANNDAVVSTTNSACGAATGSAIATPNGPAPYTYTWSNGATTGTNSNIAAGSYNLTVVDFYGCQFDSTGIIVANPNAPTVGTGTITSPNCNGNVTASADVTVSGGTPNYTYVWSPNVSTAATATNIAAGPYSVLVTDAAGCIGSVNFTITEPTVIASTNVITDETVAGNGAINLTVTGGTGAYTYLWSNGATTQNITGLAGGTYTVLITDANGCSFNGSYVVNSTLGVNEINTISALIFPNPTTEQVTVTFEGTSATLIIRDAQGKLIQSSVISNNELITLSQVQSGIYFFELTTENGTSVQRVVKK